MRQDQADRIEHALTTLAITIPAFTATMGDLAQVARLILHEVSHMARNFEALKATVTNLETVSESAITLLRGLAQEIRDLEPTQQAIDELATRIDGDAASLAAAVANTPPPPTEPPAT